jgi:hypothetical protein
MHEFIGRERAVSQGPVGWPNGPLPCGPSVMTHAYGPQLQTTPAAVNANHSPPSVTKVHLDELRLAVHESEVSVVRDERVELLAATGANVR